MVWGFLILSTVGVDVPSILICLFPTQVGEFQARRAKGNKEVMPIRMSGNIHRGDLFLISDTQLHLAEK